MHERSFFKFIFPLQTEIKECESFTKVAIEKGAGDWGSTCVTTAQVIISCAVT